MAYNKSIADELKAKLNKLGIEWNQAEANTCHAFGLRAWKKVSKNVIIDKNKLSAIIAQQIEVPSEKTVWTECGSAIAKLASLAKQHAVGHLCALNDESKWFDLFEHYSIDEEVADGAENTYLPTEIIAAARKIYQISLDQCRDVIDFDDMILAPLVFKARFWPLDWVLIDESQDTNPARRALAMAMLKPRTGRVIFVGDDRQAIYGFTGADADAMTQLKTALNAKSLPLNVTYRCPKSVVALANTIVPDLKAHETAPEGVVRAIKYDELVAQNLTESDAILCRNTNPLITTAYSLLSNGIACRVAGREIGTGLIKLARRWKVSSLTALSGKLDDFMSRESAKLMSKNKEVMIAALEDQIECLKIMIGRCQSLNKHSISDLVKEIESMFGDEQDMKTKRLLTLMTIHRSKGLEWNRVFILGRVELIPSRYAKKAWEQEQESNLAYVAITRSKGELVDVAMPVKNKK
jgi:superfamily I DNA/RNA helicase